MTARILKSADEVIDALGGTVATANLTGRKAQHVTNWRASGRLPAKTFLVISKQLRELEKSAPPSLWGITEPEKV
jgi:hypothetical protein